MRRGPNAYAETVCFRHFVQSKDNHSDNAGSKKQITCSSPPSKALSEPDDGELESSTAKTEYFTGVKLECLTPEVLQKALRCQTWAQAERFGNPIAEVYKDYNAVTRKALHKMGVKESDPWKQHDSQNDESVLNWCVDCFQEKWTAAEVLAKLKGIHKRRREAWNRRGKVSANFPQPTSRRMRLFG